MNLNGHSVGGNKRVILWWTTLGLGAAIFFTIFLMTWQKVQCVRVGYELRQVQQRKAHLLREQEHLVSLQQQQKCLSGIERYAKTHFGLKRPGDEQFQMVFLSQRETTKGVSP